MEGKERGRREGKENREGTGKRGGRGRDTEGKARGLQERFCVPMETYPSACDRCLSLFSSLRAASRLFPPNSFVPRRTSK